MWLHELVENEADTCEPEWVSAEHPLFMLYTSGSTGKPKGVQHSTGGILLWAAAVSAAKSFAADTVRRCVVRSPHKFYINQFVVRITTQ